MIRTEYGTFDGNKWERVCQLCFKNNFREEAYQEIKATPGDFGIEGFTRTGKAFQCYCPDEHYNSHLLYENHRDKITKDLKKLKTYEKQLKKILGETKINKWYFVTPTYAKNEIVQHCTLKKEEVKSWNLSIIDNNNFEVLFENIDFLHPYLNTAIENAKIKIDISPGNEIETVEKFKWKDSAISLIEKAQTKNGYRLNQKSSKFEEKLDKLVDINVSDYLDGNNILFKWKEDYPIDYETFLNITSVIESEIEERCISSSKEPSELYQEFRGILKDQLHNSFSNLAPQMILKLTNWALADWIFRCPINFE
ncbi:hypothetical protein [Salinimicrobium sediminilitoris]|uniref:hypothetical protein n=1 Tax=Salinimicrobium sediminilitoris TaxID=2876715 RepID=UPI001E308223|nr:hypothetical protein [Salinimicrobium sediminilitoris]MCC8359768.1 hypothetical protein [Salinimicrobium sediminilitoris]